MCSGVGGGGVLACGNNRENSCCKSEESAVWEKRGDYFFCLTQIEEQDRWECKESWKKRKRNTEEKTQLADWEGEGGRLEKCLCWSSESRVWGVEKEKKMNEWERCAERNKTSSEVMMRKRTIAIII